MNGDDSRLFPVDAIASTKRRLRLRRATDGVVELREFGGWTLEKLRVMELYLKKYRQVAGNGSYIDGFAGQGSLMVADSDLEKKGSVRLASSNGRHTSMPMPDATQSGFPMISAMDSLTLNSSEIQRQDGLSTS